MLFTIYLFSSRLRHLLPGQHIMPNQLAIIGAPDLYSQAARKLLQLIPASCINAEKMFLNSIRPQPSQADSAMPNVMSRDTSSPPPPPHLTSSPTSQLNHLERPTAIRSSSPLKPGSATHSGGGHISTNPFDHLPVSRSRSGSDASTSKGLTHVYLSCKIVLLIAALCMCVHLPLILRLTHTCTYNVNKLSLVISFLFAHTDFSDISYTVACCTENEARRYGRPSKYQ